WSMTGSDAATEAIPAKIRYIASRPGSTAGTAVRLADLKPEHAAHDKHLREKIAAAAEHSDLVRAADRAGLLYDHRANLPVERHDCPLQCRGACRTVPGRCGRGHSQRLRSDQVAGPQRGRGRGRATRFLLGQSVAAISAQHP